MDLEQSQQEQEPPKVVIPSTSKYVPGGYTARKRNADQAGYIEERMVEMDENPSYTRYNGPVTIVDRDHNLVPIPGEANPGGYAEDDGGDKRKITRQDRERQRELDGNLFYISGVDGEEGIIRRGMHIKYLRKEPRNFVKGGFIRHINSTYIAFRFARGSSVVQLKDIETLFVSNQLGRPKKEKPKFKIVLKPKKQQEQQQQYQSDFQDEQQQQQYQSDFQQEEQQQQQYQSDFQQQQQEKPPQQIEQDIQTQQQQQQQQQVGGFTFIGQPYMPRNVNTIKFQKAQANKSNDKQRGGARMPRTDLPKAKLSATPPIVSHTKAQFVDPLTGKIFRDEAHLKQFTNSKKYKKMVEEKDLPFDPLICCPQCKRRFRDAATLKRHMNTKKFSLGNCL